jgi:hypothetical protein
MPPEESGAKKKCRRLSPFFLRNPPKTVPEPIGGAVATGEALSLEILGEYLNHLAKIAKRKALR